MPILRITTVPGYQLKAECDRPDERLSISDTMLFVKVHLSEDFPALMVQNASKLGLDPTTPLVGVLVINDDFGDFTVNAPGVWIQVQFSEDEPSLEERMRIRDEFDKILLNWFADRDLTLDDYTLDLFWGPTNGRGVVNGVKIVW